MRRPRPAFARLAITALGLCCFASVAADAATAATAPKIPFVVGLSTVRAVSEPAGDYETLMVITSIDASGYRAVRSGELPGTDGGEPVQLTIPRKVLAADRANARKIRAFFADGDPETFPGTVPGFSTAVINDLRTTGKAAITYLDIGNFFGTYSIKGEYSGTLARVVDPSPTLSVLVNGRDTKLPVLHAKGTLTGRKGPAQFEYFVLDDPANPIVLRWSGLGASSTILRIEYPEPKEARCRRSKMRCRNLRWPRSTASTSPSTAPTFVRNRNAC